MAVIPFGPLKKKNSPVENLRAESLKLLDAAFRFVVDGAVDEEDFAESYILEHINLFGYRTPELYDANSAFLRTYPRLSRIVGDIYIMAGSFKPAGDRFTLQALLGDTDEDCIMKGQLRESVKALLVECGFLADSYDAAQIHRFAAEAITLFAENMRDHADFFRDTPGDYGNFPADPAEYAPRQE